MTPTKYDQTRIFNPLQALGKYIVAINGQMIQKEIIEFSIHPKTRAKLCKYMVHFLEELKTRKIASEII